MGSRGQGAGGRGQGENKKLLAFPSAPSFVPLCLFPMPNTSTPFDFAQGKSLSTSALFPIP
ncbi:hypothetical protein COO91_07467 [Nostoc flagelliforme CCNUN1]|uniref:Uncharacterized protein n=1 Tax=Nostoc flagelliforme CCNUN1 TaxID=2038116 RepID=A0A2K8T171_9NOSO|nr:hypothetical protein COO91_07467 [Nostoc flagelliforme CCNUN1]